MATLENIRKRGKLLAIVIGFALAAFIIGDFFNSGSTLFGSNKMQVVKINGNGVDVNDYEEEITKTEEFVKASQGVSSLDEQTAQQVRASVWDMIIRDNILASTYKELGLTISKEEVEDMVLGNNIHPIIAQTFRDPNTGVYDKNIMVRVLQNLSQDAQLNSIWMYLEKYIKRDRVYTKYQVLVTKGLYVNKLEVKQDNYDRQYVVNIDLVGKSVAGMADSSITYTEEDLKKYYDEHKHLFTNTEESRDIEYIAFDVKASKLDSLDAKDNAKRNIDVFKQITASTLNFNYYSSKDLKSYNIDSNVWDMPKDTVFGPFAMYDSYFICRVGNRTSRPDTVSARHILISNQNSSIGTMERAHKVADSLLEVIKNGGDFDALVQQYSDDPGSKDKGGLYEDFTEGSMVKEFNDFCFENKTGDMGTVETTYGVHIIEITRQSNPDPKIELAFDQYRIIPSQTTFDSVYSIAMTLRGGLNSEEEFNKAVEDSNYVKRQASDITQGTYTIPGFDNVREVVRWAFDADKGDVSNVFQMEDKYVIAVLTNKNEVGYYSLNKVRAKVEGSVILQKKVDKIYNDYFTNANTSDIDALASKVGVQKQSLPNVSFNAFQLSNFGYEPAVLAAISKIKEGDVVGPIKGVNGVYVIKATSVMDVTELTPEQLTVQQKSANVSLQSRAGYQVFPALKSSAEIIDHRTNFY